MINKILSSGLFQARWVGCDCAFGGDKEFRDSLSKTVWFFADVHAKNLVWRQRPEWVILEYKGRGKKPEKAVQLFDIFLCPFIEVSATLRLTSVKRNKKAIAFLKN